MQQDRQERPVNVQDLIARLNASDRLRASSHFSNTVYQSEPIFTTGRQMASYLPDRYREMRAISRLQERNGRKHWLSEAELFVQQARFMEDFEDDCPYHGRFVSYFPTYAAMSDRQLRGYFTWRAAVRAGHIEETCLSFAYVYLYELINGIGVSSPRDGFAKLQAFWTAYRPFAPEIDRYARVWLHDYAIYHGLDAALLDHDPGIEHDRSLLELIEVSIPFDPMLQQLLDQADEDRATVPDQSDQHAQPGTLPFPPDTDLEERMIAALDAFSTYRIARSKLYRERPENLRHVACAVYIRMLAHYRKRRSHGLIESCFGEVAEMPYTMFGSAVFFEEHLHADAMHRLDTLRSYRCHKGLWTCRRMYGGDGQSRTLGDIMHAVDCRLRAALGYEPALQERKTPKYLARIIDREIDDWLDAKPLIEKLTVRIDRSKLAGIRSAAAETREALLTEEEREDDGGLSLAGQGMAEDAPRQVDSPAEQTVTLPDAATEGHVATTPGAPAPGSEHGMPEAPGATTPLDMSSAPKATDAAPDLPVALDDRARAYLTALIEGVAPQTPAGISEDMLVDQINEALFDELGDTAIEFGPEGPQIIEDYEDDIRRLMGL